MKKSSCFMIIGLLWQINPYAAEFCVTNNQELHDALDVAESNSQDDLIKIAEGNYNGGFYYNGDMNYDLTINGSWKPFFHSRCDFMSNSPFNTILDGNHTEGVMQIQFYGSSQIHISHMTFTNGNSDPLAAGGLFVGTAAPNPTGRILIENSAFINNEGVFTAALQVIGGDRTTVRNSLFTTNQTTHHSLGYIINLDNYSHGIYFNNNTVVNNVINGAGIQTGVRLVGDDSGVFVANNILWNNDGSDLRLELSGSGTNSMLFNNNIGQIVGSVFDSEANNYSVKPQFESGLMNFQPNSNSIEINNGGEPPPFIPVPTPFGFEWGLGDTDINGNPRVQDGQVEIGAYEATLETPIFINGFELTK